MGVIYTAKVFASNNCVPFYLMTKNVVLNANRLGGQSIISTCQFYVNLLTKQRKPVIVKQFSRLRLTKTRKTRLFTTSVNSWNGLVLC
jgi:hypothetical protein